MKSNVRPIQISVDELQSLYEDSREKIEPGEFTTEQFATANGLDMRGAENFLASMFSRGKVTKRRNIFVEGRFHTVFKIVKDKE